MPIYADDKDNCVGRAMKSKLWTLLPTSALLLLSGITLAQRGAQGRILTISGQAGQANVVEVGGRAYVEVEGLTHITHGTLSFDANRIILSFPSSIVSPPAGEPAQTSNIPRRAILPCRGTLCVPESKSSRR